VSVPVARASSTLGWVGILLAASAFLVERARADIDGTRDQLADERGRRIDAEYRAEQLRVDLDGALEALHDAKAPRPPAGA
jgi:hypothetical protein